MILSSFETYIKNLINNPAVDAFLRDEVRNAGLWLESNYTFLYMESFRAFTQAIGNRYITLSSRPKRIELLRQVRSDGTYLLFDQVHPRDFDEEDFAKLGGPTVFWIDGQGGSPAVQLPRLVLNMTPTAAMNMEILEVRLTDWDAIADSTSHWLFDAGRTAFTYKVLEQLFGLPLLRDAEGMQMVAPLLQKGLDTVLNLDDELRRSVRSEEMRYGRGV